MGRTTSNRGMTYKQFRAYVQRKTDEHHPPVYGWTREHHIPIRWAFERKDRAPDGLMLRLVSCYENVTYVKWARNVAKGKRLDDHARRLLRENDLDHLIPDLPTSLKPLL